MFASLNKRLSCLCAGHIWLVKPRTAFCLFQRHPVQYVLADWSVNILVRCAYVANTWCHGLKVGGSCCLVSLVLQLSVMIDVSSWSSDREAGFYLTLFSGPVEVFCFVGRFRTVHVSEAKSPVSYGKWFTFLAAEFRVYRENALCVIFWFCLSFSCLVGNRDLNRSGLVMKGGTFCVVWMVFVCKNCEYYNSFSFMCLALAFCRSIRKQFCKTPFLYRG